MKHKTLAERDAAAIWHPFTQMATAGQPIAISHGKGARLFDENGKTYIDGIASWWMNLHGHAHPLLAQRLYAQASQLEHVIFANFTHKPAVELAEALLAILPDTQKKVFYSDNGSTAVEVAVKMALQYWHNSGQPQRRKIVALHGAYHGDTFGAMSVGARSAFTRPFEPFLFEVLHIDPPRDAQSAAQLQTLIDQYPDQIAAFVFEPLVQGAAGMQMHSAAQLDALIGLAQRAGILCIADEVMTGFGRTGKNFATDYCQNKPDIYCLSKGLAAGMLPLGLTSCTQVIYEAFCSADDPSKTFFHGHSHAGNPMVCAVALASLELLQTPDTQANIQRIIAAHQAFAQKLQTYSTAQNIRTCGVILAFEWQPQQGGERSYFSQLGAQIWNFFIRRGLILRPLGNTIYILPPYCITDEELEALYSGIVALLDCDGQEYLENSTNPAVTSGDIFI